MKKKVVKVVAVLAVISAAVGVIVYRIRHQEEVH